MTGGCGPAALSLEARPARARGLLDRSWNGTGDISIRSGPALDRVRNQERDAEHGDADDLVQEREVLGDAKQDDGDPERNLSCDHHEKPHCERFEVMVRLGLSPGDYEHAYG